MTDYCAYAVELRRKLHQCPEIGFDLPKTLAIVKGELDRWGICAPDIALFHRAHQLCTCCFYPPDLRARH